MYQIFENEPNWGGLCIDDKNNYKHTLLEMAGHFGHEDDVLLLDFGSPSRSVRNQWSAKSALQLLFAQHVVDL